jgi:hypothetical protein
VKSEAHKASTSLPMHSAPSIQEPMVKAETKDEEMIHDSDFEEPSGILSLFRNILANKLYLKHFNRLGRSSISKSFTSR